MSIPAGGRYTHHVSVRFRDLDPMGHAHHTLPLIYVEEARTAFFRMVKGTPELDALDFVMREITVQFHARIRFPSTITVSLTVQHVGGKSFIMAFELHGETGELVSSGSAVHIAYDYAASRSKEIDAADRAILEQWRAAVNAGGATTIA